MSEGEYTKWADNIRDNFQDYGEASFTKEDPDGTFIYKVRATANPYTMELYLSDPETVTSVESFRTEADCLQRLKEILYHDKYHDMPDYIKGTDESTTYQFALAKGYPRGFNMEQYAKEIEEAVDHINSTHNKDGFRITISNIAGGSFELTAQGTFPGWQMHFVRYLTDKTNLSTYRDTKGRKSILTYEESY